ncbi:hypothetical protein WMY93_021190 [Mugilogobius chulae]|uniref:PH domain-containing protein n=1 Tax=Mugilogobius chulae TaxID=88201 RepID=A0AAW0NB46_9GOBI
MSNEEQEGEKENVCNDKTSTSKPKRKKKDTDDLITDPQGDKKKRKKKKVTDSEEATLLEDQGEEIETSEGETTSKETMEDQVKKDSCTSHKTIERLSDNDSSDPEVTVVSAKPTRSGRLSKPVQCLNYPAKEDKDSSSDTTLTSPTRQTSAAAKAKCKTSGKRAKQAQQQSANESKKPKLITLRASRSEDSDDEEEGLDSPHFDNENSSSAFVPAVLCSPKPVVPEVEETMEELDILPDVLGMSKNTLCPDASCEQNETDCIEPCEHQLDLLVDVIDFLSEHVESCSNLAGNGNLVNLSQPTESQETMSDHTTNIESSQCSEIDDTSKPSLQLDEIAQGTSQPSAPEVSSTSQISDTQSITSSEESCSTQNNSSLPKKGRFSKIKPKPNLASRTAKQRTLTVAAEEAKQVELEATTSSPSQSSEELESTRAMSQPLQTESSLTDNTPIVMSSPVSQEQCGLQNAPKQTPETSTSIPLTEHERASTIQQNNCDLSTLKDKVEVVQGQTPINSDLTTTSQLMSLEHPKESVQLTSAEISATQTLDTQVVRSSDESCCSQETTSASQLSSHSVKNPSAPRKGRLSKIKPKPNVCASRTSKLPLKSGITIEKKMQIDCEIAGTSEPLSAALSVPRPEVVCCGDVDQESLTFKRHETEPAVTLETSQTQEQTEPESQSTFETHLFHLQEKSGTSFVQCEAKPQDQLKPVTKSAIAIESGNMHSTQSDQFSEEDKSSNTRPVQQSNPSSESSKLGTPQRRRWIPKVKPNLVSSPRTAKSKVDANEKSHMTDKLEKLSSVTLPLEQQAHQESTSTKPQEDKMANTEQSSTSSVSILDISMDAMVTQQASRAVQTNTAKVISSSVSEHNTGSTDKVETENISKDSSVVGKLSVANQANSEHGQLIKCASFDSDKTALEPKDTTHVKAGICEESRTSSSIYLETSEISIGHPELVDAPAELSSELQHNKAVTVSPSGSGKVRESSGQNTFVCPNIFPSLHPDQVPSDPDEPFFILSLTEIPVEAQHRHPFEPVVPPAAGIDISLSNIHIPTPEKAALSAGPICVEEYLQSAPSSDMNILAQAQEHPTVRRLTLPEVQDNSNSDKVDTQPTQSQTPVINTVSKTNSRRNLSSKAAANDANTNISIDHGKTSAHVQSSRRMDEKNSKTQRESDSKLKTKSAETMEVKPQHRKTTTSSKFLCGQNKSEEQTTEASISQVSSLHENSTVSSAAVKADDSSQQDNKKDKVRGNSNRKNEALNVAKVDNSGKQRKSKAMKSSELVSHQSDPIESSLLEEEPTNVSQYFLSDVFTEVESDDSPLTEKSNNDTTCTDKMQSQTAETIINKKQKRQTKASNTSSRGECSSVTEQQPPEVSVTKETTSSTVSVIEISDPSELDNKKSRGKGRNIKKNKNLCESSQSQKKCKEAVKSSKTDAYDTFKEIQSTSSMGRPLSQRRSLRSSSELSVSKNVSSEHNLQNKESTSVSQNPVGHVFTEVETSNYSATGKLSKDDACTEKTQTSETKRKTRRQIKAKASCSSQSLQQNPPTEEQMQETSIQRKHKSTNLDQSDKDEMRGKERANRRNTKSSVEVKARGSRSQRQCTAAQKSPETPPTESIKDNPSPSQILSTGSTLTGGESACFRSQVEWGVRGVTDSGGSWCAASRLLAAMNSQDVDRRSEGLTEAAVKAQLRRMRREYRACMFRKILATLLQGTRRGSLGVTAMGNFSGKKFRAAFESAAVCGSNPNGKTSAPVISDPSTLEPKFNLLAHVTLKLKHIYSGFKTHDLSVAVTEESSFWLPLYGNICCRLVAQPQCMLTPVLYGHLKVKGQDGWKNAYGVLKGRSLVCYQSEEIEISVPSHVIPITKDSLISVSEQTLEKPQSIHISTKTDREDVVYTVTADDHSAGQWQQCCTELMKFEESFAPKSIAVKQGSLFHEIVTPAAPKEGFVVSDLSAEMHNLLGRLSNKINGSLSWLSLKSQKDFGVTLLA